VGDEGVGPWPGGGVDDAGHVPGPGQSSMPGPWPRSPVRGHMTVNAVAPGPINSPASFGAQTEESCPGRLPAQGRRAARASPASRPADLPRMHPDVRVPGNEQAATWCPSSRLITWSSSARQRI
jgi:hypothetical protein